MLIIQNPGPDSGPMKQEAWRAEQSVFLTSSWPGKDVMVRKEEMGPSLAPLRASDSIHKGIVEAGDAA